MSWGNTRWPVSVLWVVYREVELWAYVRRGDGVVCFCFGGWSPCVEGGGVVRGVVRSVTAPTELLLHSILKHHQ